MRRRRDLGDVHGRQHRGEPDADTAQDAIKDERCERRRPHAADRSQAEFRESRAKRADQKQDRRRHQPALASQAVGNRAARDGADHATKQSAGHGPAGKAVPRRFGKIAWHDEIMVDRGHRAGDDRRVISKQQTAQRRDQREADDKIRAVLRHDPPRNFIIRPGVPKSPVRRFEED